MEKAVLEKGRRTMVVERAARLTHVHGRGDHTRNARGRGVLELVF
jgi:hypothetical protein